MTVTVVICTRNRPSLLEKCLAGVKSLTPQPDQLLVIDNSEGDPETMRIAQSFGARYVVEPKPGLRHAMKRASLERQTDMLAFLTDQTVPPQTWLASLLSKIPEQEDSAEERNFTLPTIH